METDKNEQLTLLRQRRKKYVKGSVSSEGHLKKSKNRRERDAYLGLYLYIYVIKQPDPARETVPLRSKEKYKKPRENIPFHCKINSSVLDTERFQIETTVSPDYPR